MKKTKTILLPLGVLLGVLCIALYASGWFQSYRLTATLIALGISLIVFITTLVMERKRLHQAQRRMDDVFSENSEIASKLFYQFAIPCALIEYDG